MTLGEKIREQRKKAGLSQEQLAEKLCVSRQAITKWETDKGIPDVANLIAISDEFGLSLDELIKGDAYVMNKIKKNTDIVKSSRKLIIFGFVAVFIGIILTLLDVFTDNNAVIDFIGSAAPWVILGIGIAFAGAFLGSKKEK